MNKVYDVRIKVRLAITIRKLLDRKIVRRGIVHFGGYRNFQKLTLKLRSTRSFLTACKQKRRKDISNKDKNCRRLLECVNGTRRKDVVRNAMRYSDFIVFVEDVRKDEKQAESDATVSGIADLRLLRSARFIRG